jgi:5-methylthioribose kinase
MKHLTVCTVGDGAYSQVFHVIRKSDNKEYAIKQVCFCT